MNLPTMAKKPARWQGNLYVKMPMSQYTGDTTVKIQQKLVDRGFQDLCKALQLATAKTDIAKIVKFVLDQKIEVSKDNIDHSDAPHYTAVTGGGPCKKYKQLGFKVGRFTKGENKIIQDN